MPDNLESALESAFSDNTAPPPKAAPAPPPEPDEPVDEAADVEEAVEGVAEVEEEAQEEEQAIAELAIDIEIDGQPETITGTERVKELVAKGLKAGRGYEENARVREALTAHVNNAALSEQFQKAVFADITELKALDAQLETYNRVDWNAAFDTNAFEALKLKEQRDQLREARQNKIQQITQKEQQFSAAIQQGQQRVLAAEAQALLAKLPEWRNGEKAQSEQKAIASWLGQAGFNNTEVGNLTDHRMLLVARKAYLYDQLQASKAGHVKQARQAPPVVKPGAKPTPTQSGKAEFAKFRSTVKQLGTKGNHKAQENLVLERLNRAFKIS